MPEIALGRDANKANSSSIFTLAIHLMWENCLLNKFEASMKKIITFLTINGKAEEAANFYVSVFKNSKITGTWRCGADGPGPEGSVLSRFRAQWTGIYHFELWT